jgi:hypothetical protein
MQRHTLSRPQPHIVHVLQNMTISGCADLITTIARNLPRSYTHTVLHETPHGHVNDSMVWIMQDTGIEILAADVITHEDLESGPYSAAILYNVQGKPDLGRVLPSIYYANGRWDPTVNATVTVPSTEYAAHADRAGNPLDLSTELVIPPMIETRGLRNLRVPPQPFTVAYITSGLDNKYASKLVIALASQLPGDVRLCVTRLDRYPHPGVQLALDTRWHQHSRSLLLCWPMATGGQRYTVYGDVFVYANNESFYEPAGRAVVEAMALGKAVVCERRGVFAETLEHGVNALLFDTPAEALEHIEFLRRDTRAREQLGANAQMWAAWQDVGVHIGKLKRLLRAIGV